MKIVLQDLTKTFPGRSKKEPSEVVAVDHFNFEIPDGKLIALDQRSALEMVTVGDVNIEYDKLIDRQLERAAITSTYGFAKIFPDAVRAMNLA